MIKTLKEMNLTGKKVAVFLAKPWDRDLRLDLTLIVDKVTDEGLVVEEDDGYGFLPYSSILYIKVIDKDYLPSPRDLTTNQKLTKLNVVN